MMNKLKKIIEAIKFTLISLFITLFLAYSYFNAGSYSSHDLLSSNTHSILFSSKLNNHHDEAEHVHKHRHSEKDEEHSHKHINMVSFSEIVINEITYIQFLPIEIKSIVPNTYNIKTYNSYILEILRPPIFS